MCNIKIANPLSSIYDRVIPRLLGNILIWIFYLLWDETGKSQYKGYDSQVVKHGAPPLPRVRQILIPRVGISCLTPKGVNDSYFVFYTPVCISRAKKKTYIQKIINSLTNQTKLFVCKKKWPHCDVNWESHTVIFRTKKKPSVDFKIYG